MSDDAAKKVSAAVRPSGTVATPSHADQPTSVANAAATNAARRSAVTRSAPSAMSSVATIPRTKATACATKRLRPNASIAAPLSQKGKGSQLVPVGSSFGARAHVCARTTRA